MGVTVTVSSGDDGANSKDDNQCLCAGEGSTVGYTPSFPATSPWVTAVGATMGPESGSAEITCQSDLGGVITTGGGFSNYYSVPSWQREAITQYFASVTTQPVAGYGTGRGYPDIALIGVNYQIVVNGKTGGVYGTSCSAPVMAALVSLVNAARLEKNLSSIGFINPTLYSVGINNTQGLGNQYNASFNDIVSGDNLCCSQNDNGNAPCCSTGFYTASGWDPVTGWGSIFYPDFSAIFSVATPYTPTDDDDDSSSSGLSAGAIAGIVIGVIVGVAFVSMIAYWFYTMISYSPPPSQPTPAVVVGTPIQSTYTTSNVMQPSITQPIYIQDNRL
eukprot:scaffold125_cov156-Ochromonas_danica.AAC.1